MEAILSSDDVKGDPMGPAPVAASLQQIIMAISYLGKVEFITSFFNKLWVVIQHITQTVASVRRNFLVVMHLKLVLFVCTGLWGAPCNKQPTYYWEHVQAGVFQGWSMLSYYENHNWPNVVTVQARIVCWLVLKCYSNSGHLCNGSYSSRLFVLTEGYSDYPMKRLLR